MEDGDDVDVDDDDDMGDEHASEIDGEESDGHVACRLLIRDAVAVRNFDAASRSANAAKSLRFNPTTDSNALTVSPSLSAFDASTSVSIFVPVPVPAPVHASVSAETAGASLE